MTIETTTGVYPATGNGSTVQFPVPFYFSNDTDLAVTVNATAQTYLTDYTVTGAGVVNGARYITFTTAPLSGDEIVIARVPPFTQTVDLTNNDELPPEEMERGYDRIVMQTQYLLDQLGNTLRFPLSTTDVDTILPPMVADSFMAANSSANALEWQTASGLTTITVSARSEWIDDDGDSDGITAAYTDQGAAGYELEIAGANLASLFHPLRRVKVSGTATGVLIGEVDGSDYNTTIAGSTYVRLGNLFTAGGVAGTLSNEALTVWLGIGSYQGPSLKPTRMTPFHFGAVGDGITDDTVAFEAWAAYVGAKHIPNGTYVVKKQLSFTTSQDITFGDVTLDFSTATVGGDFPNLSCVSFNGPALSALPSLSLDVEKGDYALTFISAPGVVAGEVILVYNDTDSSWSAHNTVYRAGEMYRVNYTSGSVTQIWGGSYDSYTAANVEMHKLGTMRVSLSGARLNVKVPTALTNLKCISLFRCIDSRVDNVVGEQGGHSSLYLEMCYNVSGTAVSPRQSSAGGLGVHYGMAIENCQKIRFDGDFYGGRRGVITGGVDATGAVVNREIHLSGSFACSPVWGDGACGAHGNTEHYIFDGFFRGRVYLAGDYGTVRGHITAPDSVAYGSTGVCIQFTEMLGCHFDASDCLLDSVTDPLDTNVEGTINLGGNATTVMNSYTTRGGTLNFSGIQMSQPESKRAVMIRNRGATGLSEPVIIDLSNMHVLSGHASTTNAVYIDAVSGDNFDRLIVEGFTQEPDVAYTVSGVDAVQGWSCSGEETVNTTTGISTVTASVTFPRVAPRAPFASVDSEASAIGTKVPVAGVDSTISTTGFTARLSTYDSSNFSSAVARKLRWIAALDE